MTTDISNAILPCTGMGQAGHLTCTPLAREAGKRHLSPRILLVQVRHDTHIPAGGSRAERSSCSLKPAGLLS